MKYYATLVGKTSYAFNRHRFVKGETKEVSLEVYQVLCNSDLFKTSIGYCGPNVEDIKDYCGPNVEDIKDYFVATDLTMNVVLAYSPNWSQYVRVQVYSLFKNNPPPIKVFLLSDTLGKIDLDPICSLFGKGYSYEFINVGEVFDKYITSKINVSTRFTKYTLYRLLMPMLLPSTVTRLLYVDTDAIVCGNIRDFYSMTLRNNILAGVQDIGIAMPCVLKGIGFPTDATYINAGVTLMNLAKVRSLNLQSKWLAMINTIKYLCHDQDIFNITCRNKIAIVPNIYNASLSTGSCEEPKIMHYAGSKPWNNIRVPNYHIWENAVLEYNDRHLPKIPKRIHYCWFGGKEKPSVVKECIASWKEHMPSYDIIEWNETNFDLTMHGNFVSEAAALQKWAFVTDYVRLHVLYHYGGIYMDSDVKVLKPLDRFLRHSAFTGHETNELLITATMGAVPEHPWIKYLLSYYATAKFVATPNTITISKMSKPLIIKQEKGFTYLKDDVTIYPIETFCSYDHQNLKPIPTNNAYAYHLFAGTWVGRTII